MGTTTLFGRYRLLEPAGSGGSAEVWRAIDRRTGDEVAVKRLHPIVFGTDAGRQRLAREFRALKSLRHPSIVRVRDLQLGSDEAAIVLDYVHGRSLAQRLAAGPAPTTEEAVTIASDVAAALSAAHAQGIVHRDVTPGNVLLDGDGRARLTDFGIARTDGDETIATGTGQLIGTLRYIAPEQLRGEPATPTSDLFGLAAVTYEMLAGRPAFAATTPVGLVEEHARPAAPIDGVPAGIDAAVRQALSTDPGDRQPSVEAFATQLRQGLGVVASPEERDAAGADVLPAAGAVGIAGLWAGANPAAGSAAAPTSTSRAAGRRRTRRATGPLVGLVGVGLAFGALAVVALAPRDQPETQAAAPTEQATASPTAEATPVRADDKRDRAKGDGHGKDKDKGHGKGHDGD